MSVPSIKDAFRAAPKQAWTLLDEFRQFAFKGNVIDLAIGVIVGTAFGKLVDSLVKNLLLPLIATLIPGDKGYADWHWMIGENRVPYGKFLADMVNFLLVALAVFVFLVKFLGWLTRMRKEDKPAPLSKQEELLTEIRDLLKRGQEGPANG